MNEVCLDKTKQERVQIRVVVVSLPVRVNFEVHILSLFNQVSYVVVCLLGGHFADLNCDRFDL